MYLSRIGQNSFLQALTAPFGKWDRRTQYPFLWISRAWSFAIARYSRPGGYQTSLVHAIEPLSGKQLGWKRRLAPNSPQQSRHGTSTPTGNKYIRVRHRCRSRRRSLVDWLNATWGTIGGARNRSARVARAGSPHHRAEEGELTRTRVRVAGSPYSVRSDAPCGRPHLTCA